MAHTILSIAYPLMTVGPDEAGGSEQVLTLLDKAMTRAGHTSLVVAASGSTVTGTLIEAPAATGEITESLKANAQAVHGRLIEEALRRYPVDLVHMHSLDFHRYIPSGLVPVLSTLHLPVAWYPPRVFRNQRLNYFLNCVSSSQERKCPRLPSLLPSIPNGVEVDRFRSRAAKENYALSLGRICPEKGFHLAIDAARRARTSMILAGQVFPYAEHEEYFRKEIQPRMDGRRRFVGPVGFAGKRKLLARARCLLVPSLVDETSSLVAMEALAAGTPVVAFRAGALPEIVEHGRTGFIVADTDEMADAIRDASKLDPEDCRQAAQTRFSAKAMAERYLDLYERIMARSRYQAAGRRDSSWLFSWNTGARNHRLARAGA